MSAKEAQEILDKQVEAEEKAIKDAPAIEIPAPKRETGQQGRCSGCGQWSEHLVPCHDYSFDGKTISNERYKGLNCCGGRHAQ